MDTKICKKCHIERDVAEYKKDKKMKEGIVNICKHCENEKLRGVRQKKIEDGSYVTPDRSEYNKKYYLENKENIIKYRIDYYRKNCEKKKEYQRNRRIVKREYYKEYLKNYNKQNRDKIQAKKVERYKTDINFKVTHLLRSRFLETVKNNYKTESVIKMLGCSVEEFKKYIESKFLPGMTWDNHGFGAGKWHLDHIKPCDSYDLTKPEDQLECFHYTNFQPLWQEDNLRKGCKYDSSNGLHEQVLP